MKLVQLLAKKLKEWPEYDEGSDPILFITQDASGEIFSWNDNGELKFADGRWYMQGTIPFDELIFDGSETCSDCSYEIVREDQWYYEREKMNKPKWIRHRGGKCPVADDVKVLYRMRSGTITSRGEPSSILSWDHSKNGGDIMAYRVIEETKDQEIEEVKDTNIGTLSITLDVNDVFKPMIASMKDIALEWGQIESPLKWRDAIIHCQAIIEDCEREIQRNVNLLDAEGLMMQKDSKKAMQYYQTDIDMSDWRNWQIGDLVCATKNFDDADIGDELIITRLYHADEEQPIGMSTGSSATYWPEINWVKFVSRP